MARPPAARRPTGWSLHIGLNAVSPAAYAGWSGDLAACEFDAEDMTAIAASRGLKATTLLTKAGTRKNVLAAMRKAAKALKAGDFFFLSYSGHGGQVPDTNADEPDRQDETWCLFDGQLLDDELYYELSRFAVGVRILVLSDSCHSGTVTRAGPTLAVPAGTRARLMPPSVASRVYGQNQAFYDNLQADLAKAAGGLADPDAAIAQVVVSQRRIGIVKQFKPAVILISGCQDNQVALDGAHNGAFTEQLLAVWNHGRFAGSYASLHQRVRARLPPTQSPNLFTLGPAAAFLAQDAFTL
jgi:hypothetical protein